MNINLSSLINKLGGQIINVVLLIVAVMSATNIYKAHTKEMDLLRQTKEMELQKNEILKEISSLESKYENYKKLINNKDVSLSIENLGNIASDVSVKIVSLKPQGEREFNRVYTRYTFDLVLEAPSYHKIGEFVSNLEKNPALYAVESCAIRVEVSPKEGEKDITKADLRVSTIVLKD